MQDETWPPRRVADFVFYDRVLSSGIGGLLWAGNAAACGLDLQADETHQFERVASRHDAVA
jgi:hypothetical protein